MDTLIFLYMVKGIKKKKIKKPKKTKRTNMYYAKFYPPKKKHERQNVNCWMEKGNFSNAHLPHFLSYFLSILERLNFGESREKTVGPFHFFLPLPLSTKHPSH